MSYRVSSPSGLLPKKHRNPYNILEKSMGVCEETIYKSYVLLIDDDDDDNNDDDDVNNNNNDDMTITTSRKIRTTRIQNEINKAK